MALIEHINGGMLLLVEKGMQQCRLSQVSVSKMPMVTPVPFRNGETFDKILERIGFLLRTKKHGSSRKAELFRRS